MQPGAQWVGPLQQRQAAAGGVQTTPAPRRTAGGQQRQRFVLPGMWGAGSCQLCTPSGFFLVLRFMAPSCLSIAIIAGEVNHTPMSSCK
jgi:hypothetical protein